MRDKQKYANAVDMARDYNNDKSLILDLTQRIAELEEQLANSIRPKFEIGQECYLIDDDFNYFKNTKEFNIVRSKIKKQENWYYVKDYGVCHEDELFSTKEEAEAKLKELEEEE